MNFPDIAHLKQLQHKLWAWPRSRAAVMVGAGFSLNAEPLPGTKSKFPMWRELALAIYERLDPPEPNESPAQSKRRQEKFNATNFMRIASEYEAAFGKAGINELILSLIPDTQYIPGRLHQLLMELPWADVFTTNYDTLLEKTEVDGRSYRSVTKTNELTAAFSPRIVKLHGSFPAQTPFIISEEDYRTYPREFAPFVNSVQQSLLENSFVLLGFSGDDPNFLAWSGWIRDELGDAHAPIYLVGPLSLSGAQRKLLTRRGVTPIDLSPVFANIETPQGIHSASIAWFLECLRVERPPRPERWPDFEARSLQPSIGLPPLITSAPGPEDVDSTNLQPDVLDKLFLRWQWERENYPGWLIAPDETRSKVWQRTKSWVHPILQDSKSLPSHSRLRFFRELAWRFEIAMVPVLAEMLLPFRGALLEILENEPASFSKSTVATAWLTVAFTLWRDARESYDLNLWSEWKDKVDRVIRFDTSWTDRRNYEVALYSMWNVDRPAVRSVLIGWQPSPRSPMSMIWKAGLLSELDELGEAHALLRAALVEIRRALRLGDQNLELLSVEGWCMFLMGAVGLSTSGAATTDSRDEFRDRWDELKAWDCNPWSIKKYLDDVLSSARPEYHSRKREVPQFDPGRTRVSLTFVHDNLTPLLPAFACIRMYEQVGLPMRVSGVNIAGDALKNACRWLADSHAFWGPVHLVRAGKVESLTEDILSRPQVCGIDVTVAKRLYKWCLRIFESEFRSATGSNAQARSHEDLLEASSEVLSRLAFRVASEELAETFPILLQFYGQSSFGFRPRLYAIYEHWFRRLFQAAGQDLLIKWLPELARAPLFESVAHGLSRADPMQDYPCRKSDIPAVGRAESNNLASQAIEWLLRKAVAESGEVRQKALQRLACVYATGLMSKAQEDSFGNVLWEQKGPNDLPDFPQLHAFGFLRLPAPPNVEVKLIVKKYILKLSMANFVRLNGPTQYAFATSNSEQRLLVEASFASLPIVQLERHAESAVDWTFEESYQLFSKVLAWWKNDKVAIERFEDSLQADEVREAASMIGEFLARVLLPLMQSAENRQWDQVLEFMDDLRSNGVYPTLALPYVLLFKSEQRESVISTIDADLRSDEEDRVCTAAAAVSHWLHLSAVAVNKVPKPPDGLLLALIERVALRAGPGLSCCINHVRQLLLDLPDVVKADKIRLLVASLASWNNATLLPPKRVERITEFDQFERVALRPLVGRLAAALSLWCAKFEPGQVEPEPISRWREWCKNDPLPEVRRAFHETVPA